MVTLNKTIIKPSNIIKLSLIVIMISHPLFYFTMYSGDAEIHLVYAENAAKGHFFEFNMNEKSAGVTSPGYMLFLALLYGSFPASLIPFIVKIVNIFFWYIFLVLVFVLAKRLIVDRFWAWAATLFVSLIPGAVYNATTGMENGIFAAIFIFWFFLVIKIGHYL